MFPTLRKIHIGDHSFEILTIMLLTILTIDNKNAIRIRLYRKPAAIALIKLNNVKTLVCAR